MADFVNRDSFMLSSLKAVSWVKLAPNFCIASSSTVFCFIIENDRRYFSWFRLIRNFVSSDFRRKTRSRVKFRSGRDVRIGSRFDISVGPRKLKFKWHRFGRYDRHRLSDDTLKEFQELILNTYMFSLFFFGTLSRYLLMLSFDIYGSARARRWPDPLFRKKDFSVEIFLHSPTN